MSAPALRWEQRGPFDDDGIAALILRDQVIVNYIRWSESGKCFVDFKGTDLGRDLDAAKKVCEERATEALTK